ncbi:MAG: DUF72 domain-containing protein [Gemmatimonadales bacterium]|nr:DUF72 domain-containing protein [Gemmatimonadales bacterium]
MRQRDELAHYATQFSTVELNNPFYRLPEPETFDRWRDAVPEGFVFAVKASRYITHVRRLRDAVEPLALLLDRALRLGPQLGPVLFQLPPTFEVDRDLLRNFIGSLPADHRWVIEFRHPTWHTAEVYEELGARGVALCIPVGGRVHPDPVTTASFAYIRMHAGEGAGGAFTRDQLELWAGRLRALGRAGKDCYVYFNNDRGGHAPRDARSLLDLLEPVPRGQTQAPTARKTPRWAP